MNWAWLKLGVTTVIDGQDWTSMARRAPSSRRRMASNVTRSASAHEKSPARRWPFFTSSSRRPGFSVRRTRAAAMSLGSVGSTYSAASPATSGQLVRSEHTTGHPVWNASRIGSPKPSNNEGRTRAKAPR